MCTRDHPQQYLSFLADRERKTEKEGQEKRHRSEGNRALQEKRNERFSLLFTTFLFLSLARSLFLRVCFPFFSIDSRSGIYSYRATEGSKKRREKDR